MYTNRYFFSTLTACCFGALFFLQSCASTSYGLQEPHMYENSYEQVLDAIEKVMQAEQMVIMNAEELDGGNRYKIYFFKKSNRIDERNFETGHTAEAIIERIQENLTSVRIEEESDRSLARDDYREHLARDVFKGLEGRLNLIPKNQEAS